MSQKEAELAKNEELLRRRENVIDKMEAHQERTEEDAKTTERTFLYTLSGLSVLFVAAGSGAFVYVRRQQRLVLVSPVSRPSEMGLVDNSNIVMGRVAGSSAKESDEKPGQGVSTSPTASTATGTTDSQDAGDGLHHV